MINVPFDFVRGLEVLLTLLTLSLALCFVRLFLGPTVPNRTVAFDGIAIHAVAILALFAIRIGAASILDTAIVVAVLGFLGTTVLARYLERTAARYYALTNRGVQLSSERDLREMTRQVQPIERMALKHTSIESDDSKEAPTP
jgi:multisubunit Na+/H+ antiporter MnhF subunit